MSDLVFMSFIVAVCRGTMETDASSRVCAFFILHSIHEYSQMQLIILNLILYFIC